LRTPPHVIRQQVYHIASQRRGRRAGRASAAAYEVFDIGHEIQVLTANAGMGQFGKGNSAHGIDGAPKQTGNGFYIENRMGNGVSGHDRDRP
jgi:hypothetical protein